MKIGIDIDGILADFNKSFVQRVREVIGKDLFPPEWQTPEKIAPPTWHYDAHYGYTKEESTKVWENIKADKTFWLDLQPYEKNMKTLQTALWEGELGKHDVYFITTRMGNLVKDQTETWLEHFGIDRPTVLISAKKGLVIAGLELNCFVDDNFDNVANAQFHSPLTRSYLHVMPWNVNNLHAVERKVFSLENFFQMEGLM